MKKYKLSRNSLKNLHKVDKNIIELIKRSLSKSVHDFGIPKDGGLRTAQEQNNLFYKRPKVTWLDGFLRKSYHQSGKAFDVFLYDEHGACWRCKEKYIEISNTFKIEFEIMKNEGIFKDDENIIWGGDWKRFRDLPHFEIR